MAKLLPPKPSMEHLKKEAKAILRAFSEKKSVVFPILRNLRRFDNLPNEDMVHEQLSLQLVHHALAKEYGFRSWADLKLHVETHKPESFSDFPVELKSLMNREGKLRSWPAKRKKQLIFLDYLASQFPSKTEFNENQINEFLNKFHSFLDPALLRRELVSSHLLERTSDGRRYWKNVPTHHQV